MHLLGRGFKIGQNKNKSKLKETKQILFGEKAHLFWDLHTSHFVTII